MKPTIESSLREAIASLRVAQELTKGELDRTVGSKIGDWAKLLRGIGWVIEDTQRQQLYNMRLRSDRAKGE